MERHSNSMKILGLNILGWVLLFVLLLLSFIMRLPQIQTHPPFNYDEADYAQAVAQGFWANYLDLNSISFPDFLKKGLKSFITGTHRTLSEEIRESGDVAFYRHFHPPLVFYPSAFLTNVIDNPHYSL